MDRRRITSLGYRRHRPWLRDMLREDQPGYRRYVVFHPELQDRNARGMAIFLRCTCSPTHVKEILWDL